MPMGIFPTCVSGQYKPATLWISTLTVKDSWASLFRIQVIPQFSSIFLFLLTLRHPRDLSYNETVINMFCLMFSL